MKAYLNLVITKSIKVWHVLLILATFTFFSILIQLIVSPIKTYNTWKSEELIFDQKDNIDSLSSLLSFQQALLKASSTDSIYLVISIPDSSLAIYVKGVDIYRTKIIHYEQSTFLSRVNAQITHRQFAIPQKAQLLNASIEKEPIKVKIAPKNAEEAAKMATIPDSVTFRSASVSYKLENSTVIHFIGEKEYWLSFKRSMAQTGASLSKLISALYKFKIVEYEPEINIVANNIHLTSIYRALPYEPLIIVRL